MTPLLPKLWILEDELSSQFVYEQILSFRYDIKFFVSLADFTTALSDGSERPEILIADLRLSDGSFLNYMRTDNFKQMTGIRFVVVSSLDDIDALRLSFEHGALDFLTKPFSDNELIVKLENLRLRAASRQKSKLKERSDRLPIEIDPITSTLTFQGQTATLTPKEFQIVSLITDFKTQTTKRDEIMKRIWGGVKVGPKTLDVHLVSLRKKISCLGLDLVHSPPDSYKLGHCLPESISI